MLNRLFIVVGVLAILAIGAAFVVPGMIDWGEYRGRMQAIASEVLGTDVEIVGDIRFSLLPQPELRLGDIRVGGAENPVLTVANAEAEFSLLDFLRDRYQITRLVLQQPAFEAEIDANGQVDIGIDLAERVSTSNVSVASAEIVGGAIRILDRRSGDSFAASNIAGELRMDALRGPFAFQGTGDHDGRRFTARVSTSALDADDQSQLTLFVQPEDQSFALNAEGLLKAGAAPSLKGTLTYRQAPANVALVDGEEADVGRGDLVVTGSFEANAARVLLSDYIIVPDENRGATRLSGAAEVTLGNGPSFNAVISGGVLALPPRDATANPATLPHEFVRLLAELPVPPVPPIPGVIGVDIAEVDLRAVSLRNVRFDARASDEGWTISNFVGRLAGDTSVALDGTLKSFGGDPDFEGNVRIATRRLDALSALWRRPAEGNPLFNVPGSFDARLSLVGETLSIVGATLTIDDVAHGFSAEIGFAPATRHLNLRAALGSLDPRQSTELMALLPDLRSDAQFGTSFPAGRFQLSAETMTIAGLAGSNLEARGTWEGGVLTLDALHAGDLGGMAIDAQITAFGTFARPELSGRAKLAVERPGAPALAALYDAAGTPSHIRGWLRGALPADLALTLDAPSGEGEQGLHVAGKTGAADLTLNATLRAGLARAFQGSMAIRLELKSDDPSALTAQLGLGSISLMPEGAPMTAVAVIDGNIANSFETTVRIGGGGEELAFSGNVIATTQGMVSGNGIVRATMSDFSALTESLGVGGIWVPALGGSARVEFTGLDRIRLNTIEAVAGGEPFTGSLEWARTEGGSAVSGEIVAGRFDPRGLLAVLAGPAATLTSETAFWPDGPVAIGDASRRTTGRIAVTSPGIVSGEEILISDAAFELTWDATGARIRDFSGNLGEGRITAEVAVCCAGPIALKNLSGRLTLEDVALDSLVSRPVGEVVGASVTAAARFEGAGDSLLAALQAMTAEGTYTLEDVSIAGLDPGAFGAIESLEAVIDMEPGMVTQLIIDRLDDAAFTSTEVSGGFTIAGGVLRSPNLAIEGPDARLFGSTIIRLADLSLGGGFVMSPTRPTGPDGVLTESNAQIAANLSGTLPEPVGTYDVAGVVDTIMIEALELEVARLEQLRAEEEARQRAAAEERARIAAELAAQRAAEEEARRRQEEEEAARRAAEEAAAAQAAEAQAAVTTAPEPVPAPLQPGFNLELPPNPF